MASRCTLPLLAVLLVAMSPARAAGAPAADVPTAGDTVLERAPVPSRVLRQGEVRLVQRGSNIVVQTILFTRYLPRVSRAIMQKEVRNWPPGDADAAHFRDALAQAVQAVLRDAAGEGRVALGFDFVCGPNAAEVTFYRPDVVPTGEGLDVKGTAPMASIEVSPEYVRGNQELILQDNFGADAERVIRELRRLRPDP